ncbi:hypothetical protein EPN15_02630 [Patescibacteria group bacterium]|nr:MAG: hypothetical protein EPN15_02630 [Patescibacteria group bacterium]
MPINNSNTKSKKEPEDILAEVDKPAAPRKKTSKSPSPQPSPLGRGDGESATSAHRPFFIIGGVIAIVIVAGIAGYLVLSGGQQEKPGNKTAANNTNGQSVNANNNINAPVSSNTNISTAVNTAPKITNDADGDGLLNEDEAKSGTDPKNPDTDNDGLSDREEVKVWKTNPLKADTDGDSYNDGEEIKTLNDPKVPGGKLLDLNKAIQQLNANK